MGLQIERVIRRARAVAVLALLLLPGAASAQTLPERLAPCLACHGESGRSETPEVPSLGGQPEFYLSVQLVMFRERLRAIEPMTAMMKGVSDRDLRAMAAFIATLPPPRPPIDAGEPARMQQARTIGEQHRCNFCHARDYAGQENVPRLAGQREDYLVKTLREYKANTRRAYDTSMADVVLQLRDEDIVELGYFLARLK
jgi:cytochrome c553